MGKQQESCIIIIQANIVAVTCAVTHSSPNFFFLDFHLPETTCSISIPIGPIPICPISMARVPFAQFRWPRSHLPDFIEKLILPKVTSNIQLAHHQHDFLNGHRTTTALHLWQNQTCDGLNQRIPNHRTIMVALDLSKAFDTVSTSRLKFRRPIQKKSDIKGKTV